MASEGVCVGGPLNGQEARSRKLKGFILVNRELATVWFYDWDGSKFTCRDPEGTPEISDPGAPKNRYRAATEDEFDVLADPSQGRAEGTGDDQA